eukprot:638917-Hanusia_phi.AAC.1
MTQIAAIDRMRAGGGGGGGRGGGGSGGGRGEGGGGRGRGETKGGEKDVVVLQKFDARGRPLSLDYVSKARYAKRRAGIEQDRAK